MGIFGRGRKKPEKGKKPGKAPQPKEKKPGRAELKAREKKGQLPVARNYSGRDAKIAKGMAATLLKFPRFSETCGRLGIPDPENAFIDFYLDTKDNQMVWKAEANQEKLLEDAGKKFNRTSFYGKLFLKCRGNPKNIASVIFEWAQKR